MIDPQKYRFSPTPKQLSFNRVGNTCGSVVSPNDDGSPLGALRGCTLRKQVTEQFMACLHTELVAGDCIKVDDGADLPTTRY